MSGRRSLWRRTAAVLVTAVVMLGACGSDEEEPATTGGSETKGGGQATKTVKIGVIAPLSGDQSPIGTGIRNGVDLAIKQANEAGKIEGWTIEMAAEDDTANANVGAQAASKLASDDEVVGVVGTYNSSVALQVAPILGRVNIVQVSPGNTATELTGRNDLANQKRQFPNYFRVSTTDDIQGPFAATYALGDLKAKDVAVIHDKKTYGQGITDAFKQRFTEGGGQVLTTETINPGDKDFSAILSKIKPLQPDLIFYGGEFPEASLITSQAKQQGITVPLMGGDGIYSEQYFETAKEAGVGDLATSIGAPTDQLASARAFVQAYEAEDYAEPYGGFGSYAFDAANVIIEALAKVLPGKDRIDDAVRRAVIDAVQETDMDGITGKVSFDEFGDATTKILTVYAGEEQGGKVTWVPKKTDDFG